MPIWSPLCANSRHYRTLFRESGLPQAVAQMLDVIWISIRQTIGARAERDRRFWLEGQNALDLHRAQAVSTAWVKM